MFFPCFCFNNQYQVSKPVPTQQETGIIYCIALCPPVVCHVDLYALSILTDYNNGSIQFSPALPIRSC